MKTLLSLTGTYLAYKTISRSKAQKTEQVEIKQSEQESNTNGKWTFNYEFKSPFLMINHLWNGSSDSAAADDTPQKNHSYENYILLSAFLTSSSFLVAGLMRKRLSIQDFKSESLLNRIFKMNITSFEHRIFKLTQGKSLLGSNSHQNKPLIYDSQKVSVELLHNMTLSDPILGVKATSAKSLGLQRLVDVYDKSTKAWTDVHKFRNEQPSLYQSCMQQMFFNPQSIKVGEYQLSQSLSEQLRDDFSQLEISPMEVDEHYQNLVNKMKDLQYKPQFVEEGKETIELNQKEANLLDEEHLYKNHPFTFAISGNKEVWYDSNYIYITKNKNAIENGDFRISFREVTPCLEASILAQAKDGQLSPFYSDSIQRGNFEGDFGLGGFHNTLKLQKIAFLKRGYVWQTNLITDFVNKLELKDKKLVLTEPGKSTNYQKKNYSLEKFLAGFLFFLYAAFVENIELDVAKWGFGLTANHILGIFLLKYGVISQISLFGMIALPYYIALLVSPIHRQQLKDEENQEGDNSENKTRNAQLKDTKTSSQGALNEKERQFISYVEKSFSK